MRKPLSRVLLSCQFRRTWLVLNPCASSPLGRAGDTATVEPVEPVGVISTKSILLFRRPAPLVIVSRPSVTVTWMVLAAQRWLLVGVADRAFFPSTLML